MPVYGLDGMMLTMHSLNMIHVLLHGILQKLSVRVMVERWVVFSMQMLSCNIILIMRIQSTVGIGLVSMTKLQRAHLFGIREKILFSPIGSLENLALQKLGLTVLKWTKMTRSGK